MFRALVITIAAALSLHGSELLKPIVQEFEIKQAPVVANEEFVRVRDYIPDIAVDLKYATADNFTGQVIYDFNDAYLRYGTVMKLKGAQDELAAKGLGLKIWDAFRPVEAQQRLWEVCPNPTYVANPNNGITSHSRGDTVDITLVALDGSYVRMPTEFDDFSTAADRDYSDIVQEAADNARLLEDVMTRHGFTGYRGEWWDFSDTTTYGGDVTFIPPKTQ